MKQKLLLTGALAAGALALYAADQTQQDTRPNILFILSDDHTSQTWGVYGGILEQYAQTDNIRRIASEGAVLDNCFCTNSISTPSRAAILTGRYSHTNGVYTLEDTLVDIRMDEDGEMRILGIEGTLLLRMNFYEEQEMELLEDIYSLQEQCIPEKQETVFEELLMQNQSRYKLTERLSLPELKDDVLQVLCSRGEIQIEHTEYREEGIQIEGILHLNFLYLRGDDARPYGSWQGMIPFQHLIECSNLPENVRCTMSHHVDQIQVSMAGSEAVEVRAILAFDAFLRREIELQTIVSVMEKPLDLEQMDKRPGIVGHIVQEKEDLWELAKQYMTTVEGIMNVNELENENVKIGDKLLIFKENMSIL